MNEMPPPAQAVDARRIIHIKAGEIERVVNEAEDALIKANLGLYLSEGRIVYVADVEVPGVDGRTVVGQRIRERGEGALVEDLSKAADFSKLNAKERWEPTDPPFMVVKILRQRGERLRLPILTGVVNAPTMRSDGTLIDRPGYDAVTGLLYDPLGVAFPSIPARPSRRQAVRALGELEDLLSTFDFVDDVSRSVALSAILTALTRRSVSHAPCHAFTAHQAGSGKSMLCDLASIIATGREAAVMAQGKTPDEFEKRLGAALLAGDPIIVLDNCVQPVAGDALCQAVSQKRAKLRILGKSEAPDVPCNAFVMANGNNLVIEGDMTRRTIQCGLDPKCERPELREFGRNPLAHAKANRAELVCAALTILRAFHVEGRPKGGAPLGGFEDWSRLVRDAITWLGWDDPLQSMSQLQESDPIRNELAAIIEHWHATFGMMMVTASEVVEKLKEATGDGAQFREALMLATKAKTLTPLILAKWLQANKGRQIGNLRIKDVGMRKKVTLWALVKVG